MTDLAKGNGVIHMATSFWGDYSSAADMNEQTLMRVPFRIMSEQSRFIGVCVKKMNCTLIEQRMQFYLN